MNNIFLGKPPANIEAWIKSHQPTPPTSEPLCFTAEEDGSSVSLIGWNNVMDKQIDIFASLQYSTDNSTWQEWDGHVINLNDGQKVYIKALNPNPDGMSYYDGMQFHKFILEGKVAASGNIQYLLEETGARTDVPAYAYYNMFVNCSSLTQAPALPATTLASYCYYSMFNGCSSLTQAPELPATTLAGGCFHNMFQGCSSLTQAPALPATTLASYCYYSMFNGCSSLTQAPALPATTLANNCYFGMFQGCSSLTQAPALPAITLAISCYSYMFYNCTQFSECHMKESMNGVYDSSIHGNTTKEVIYDL